MRGECSEITRAAAGMIVGLALRSMTRDTVVDMRLRVLGMLTVLVAACGDVLDRPTDGFSLSAEDAVVIAGSQTTIVVTATATGTNPPGAIEVIAARLPAGVTALPISVPIGGTAELVVSAAEAAAQGAVTIELQGSAGEDRGEAELSLLVRGRAGTIDPTFGGNGRAGGDDQVGSLAALAADAQGRIASCANAPNAMMIRRFTPGGAADTAFSTQGLYSRGGFCFDMIASGDMLVVLFAAGSEQQLFALDATGQAGPTRDLPRSNGGSPQATQLALAPNGDILVVGTITSGTAPRRAGVWRFDAGLSPVASFTDGSFGVPGFATIVTSPYSDAHGADAVVRADGSILLLVYSPGGQVLSTYELSATGAPLPNLEYPEFGLAGMTQSSVRLASLPDERMILAGGTGDTGLGVQIGNSHFTTAQGVELLGQAGRPAIAHDLVRHPRNGMVVAGTTRGVLAWRRLDNNEMHDASFAGELTGSAGGGTARIVALAGGGFAVSGGAAGGHAIVRIWD
jgi:hypothetical protein